MNYRFISLLAGMFCLLCCHAQDIKPNLKFGNPTEEELTMTTYAPDSEAVAVVLCHDTDVQYQYLTTFMVCYSVKKRIKVLKEEGKDYANVSISYLSGNTSSGNKEIIRGLKATAYNMENGKLVKTRMKNENVFNEKLSDERTLCKFSIPQVKVGTVIEYEYELQSKDYTNIYDWYAQSSLPTLYTHYRLILPEWFRFSVDESGTEQMESKIQPTNLSFIVESARLSCEAKEYSFTGRNLPAVKDDDYVWATNDYANHVTAELNGFQIPGEIYENFSFTWEEVAGTLLEDEDFGGRLKQRNPLEAETKAVLTQGDDKRTQAAAIYRLLKSRVRWNGDYDLAGRSASSLLKEGTGSNADINFLFISMLHSAGLEACPVLLRLRDRGRLPLSHGSIKYLSTFVVGVFDTDSTMVFFDGSANDGVNVLPTRLMTDHAYVINKKGKNTWVNLQNICKSRDAMQITASIHTDGTVEGHIQNSYLNHSAAAMRRRFREADDSTKFVTSLTERRDMKMTNYQLTGHRSSEPQVVEEYDFTKTCDATADHIYLNPLVLTPWKEAPFKAAERQLPVEFPFIQSEVIASELTLPEGYEVEEMPKGLRVQLGDNDLVCRIRYIKNDNSISANYSFTINKLFFSNNEYADLKSTFDQVVQAANAMVVLKKK
jgi:hypothetical protein